MRFKPGQKIRVKIEDINFPMARDALRFKIPYVSIITSIDPDPYSNKNRYMLEESNFGWYEHEIEGIYMDKESIKNRFEILDL